MKKYDMGLLFVLIALGGILFAVKHSNKPRGSKTETKGSYVAMGDSVAAGVGLEDDSDSSACDRTDQSYPHQVAEALHYNLSNLSCSGATLPAGIMGQQNVNELLVDPQLQQLFAQPKPNLITITIGANDAHWTDILSKCYVAECGSAEDSTTVQTNLQSMSDNLAATLMQIQAHYGVNDTPHTMITGYYQIFPESVSAGCSDLVGIDAAELSWGRQFQTDLNSTIRSVVANSTFATFVPINFNGHELCTPDSWVQSLGDNQPYHPTAEGQAAFEKQITKTVLTLH